MMVENAYDLMKELSRNNIFFSFNGPISENLVIEIGDTIKQKMRGDDVSDTTMFNLFSVFVELLQNINFYSANRMIKVSPTEGTEKELGLGIIFVGHKERDYFILSGNPVENERVDMLRKKLTLIRSMDKKEIRKYYKRQLRSETEETSKGGGLGFIEVARKASGPIEFEFQPIDDRFSFFSLNIPISGE